MKKFLPFLIALFAGIAQGYSLAPANEWLQLAALAVLFFIFAGLRTAKAGFLAGLFFGIGWFVTSLAWLYVSVHDYGYQPPGLCRLRCLHFLLLPSSLSGRLSARSVHGP